MRALFKNYRLPLLAFAVAAGVGSSLARPSLHATTEAELLAELSRATGQTVDQVAWEPSRGVLADTLLGRRLLFLASSTPDGARDVYRARVRVSYEGVPLELCDFVNLTNTPIGDEHNLIVDGERAVFSTFSFDAEQAVTVLDLSGEGAQNLTEGLADRLMAAVTNLQNTGSADGIGRLDVAFEEPVRSLDLKLSGTRLALSLTRPSGAEEHAELDVTQPELTPPGVRAEAARHLPKRLVFWAVDTVRAVPWIGPAPIAFLEERAFAVRDQARRLAHASDSETVANVATLEAAVLPPATFDETQPLWPPADIPSPWSTPEPDEGVWKPPPQTSWVQRLPSVAGEEAPAPFLTTFVRPDEKRSYVRVLLVAMDMRQLDLGMEAGVEDPKPLSGPPGSGRLPRKPEIYKRTVAAFNGGFKTEHGSYGMMVDKRVLLPAVPGGATIGTVKGGQVVLGTWGKDAKEGGPPPPLELMSFRQNMDPLVEDGVVNPTKRYQWGFTLPGTSMQTERSGVCMTAQGQLMYVWGDDVSADTLGKAMRMAQCNYGIHLDMNPHHTGFTFIQIDELKGKKYKSELLTNKMEISPERYIAYAPKDFFYLLLRDPTPPALTPSEDAEPITWSPLSVLPPPKFLPALHSAQLEGVELLSVAPGRVDARLRAGSRDSDDAARQQLSDADASRTLLAIGLGAGAKAGGQARRGLVVGGQSLGETVGGAGHAWLVVGDNGLPQIHTTPPTDATDRIELVRLAEGGAALSAAKPSALAFALLDDGRMLIARAQSPSRKVIDALLLAGAREVYGAEGVERGTLYLANTEHALRTRYEEATLSLLAAPMAPRVGRFAPTVPYEKPAPPKKKN